MTEPKQVDLERALRQAVRPVEPRAGFEERVMRALEASHEPATGTRRLEPRAHWIARLAEYLGRPWRHRPLGALASATAVVALVAAGGLSYREHVQALRAKETRGEVLQALRIANEKLDTAFRLVAEETGSHGSAPPSDEQSDRDRQFN
jgi:negative regulator of sigma E activity